MKDPRKQFYYFVTCVVLASCAIGIYDMNNIKTVEERRALNAMVKR